MEPQGLMRVMAPFTGRMTRRGNDAEAPTAWEGEATPHPAKWDATAHLSMIIRSGRGSRTPS